MPDRRYVVRCDCVGEARYVRGQRLVRRQARAERMTLAQARSVAAWGCGRVVRLVRRG